MWKESFLELKTADSLYKGCPSKNASKVDISPKHEQKNKQILTQLCFVIDCYKIANGCAGFALVGKILENQNVKNIFRFTSIFAGTLFTNICNVAK